MYTGDDLSNFWGFIGLGGLFVGFAMTLVHRIWRAAFFSLGGICLLVALFWGPLKTAVPSSGPFISEITNHPTNWFLLILFGAAVLWLHQWRKELVTTPHPNPGSLSGSEIEYRAEIEKQLIALEKTVAAIKGEIAIDHPNASTMAEAFRNLDEATQIKTNRVSEQTKGYSDRLNRDSLSLQHLIYFAMQLSAESTLVYLLSIAPVTGDDENLDLNDETFRKNSNFLDEVGRCLSGHRFSDFRQILYYGETEGDQRLKELPPSKWAEGLNPIDLRRYFIAALTRRRVEYFLEKQLKELREHIRTAYGRMSEQYELQKKN